MNPVKTELVVSFFFTPPVVQLNVTQGGGSGLCWSVCGALLGDVLHWDHFY